ncbi:hypothetical protein [Nostoc sp.]|uniref:hypothetical protein n=1 Tax=Nostoc sp. TaxID=1180 RepID=UPI0035942E1E
MPYWGDILWIYGWCLVSGLIVWRMRSLRGQLCSIGTVTAVLYGVCIGILLTQGAWLPLIPSLLAVTFGGGTVLVLKQL